MADSDSDSDSAPTVVQTAPSTLASSAAAPAPTIQPTIVKRVIYIPKPHLAGNCRDRRHHVPLTDSAEGAYADGFVCDICAEYNTPGSWRQHCKECKIDRCAKCIAADSWDTPDQRVRRYMG